MQNLRSKVDDFPVFLVGNQLYSLAFKALQGFFKSFMAMITRFGIFGPFYRKQNRSME